MYDLISINVNVIRSTTLLTFDMHFFDMKAPRRCVSGLTGRSAFAEAARDARQGPHRLRPRGRPLRAVQGARHQLSGRA